MGNTLLINYGNCIGDNKKMLNYISTVKYTFKITLVTHYNTIHNFKLLTFVMFSISFNNTATVNRNL